jgi:tetratricopeptide (TPR) repeat protein
VPFLTACPPPSARAKDPQTILETESAPATLIMQGKAYAGAGDMTRAEQYFAAALSRGGDEHEVLPLLLHVCIEQRHYRAAVEYAEPMLRRHPDDLKLRVVMATIEAAMGEKSKAIDSLREVIRRSPDDAMAHYALGTILRDDVHDAVAADLEFRAYLRVAPSGAHAAEAEASLLHEVPIASDTSAPIEDVHVVDVPKRVDVPVATPIAAPSASASVSPKGAKSP